jgi:hypothetical protein
VRSSWGTLLCEDWHWRPLSAAQSSEHWLATSEIDSGHRCVGGCGHKLDLEVLKAKARSLLIALIKLSAIIACRRGFFRY